MFVSHLGMSQAQILGFQIIFMNDAENAEETPDPSIVPLFAVLSASLFFLLLQTQGFPCHRALGAGFFGGGGGCCPCVEHRYCMLSAGAEQLQLWWE